MLSNKLQNNLFYLNCFILLFLIKTLNIKSVLNYFQIINLMVYKTTLIITCYWFHLLVMVFINVNVFNPKSGLFSNQTIQIKCYHII